MTFTSVYQPAFEKPEDGYQSRFLKRKILQERYQVSRELRKAAALIKKELEVVYGKETS